MQLRVVVRLSEAREHKIVWILQERLPEPGGREHRRVERGLVGMALRVLGRRGRRRGRGRASVAPVVIDDAQLHDRRRVDGSTVGWR